MTEAQINGHVLTFGRLTLDFGVHNQQAAWNFAQTLKNHQVEVKIDGELEA